MPDEDRAVREIGTVRRAHGLRGDLDVQLITDRVERLAEGSSVRVGQTWTVVRSARPRGARWMVRLEGIDDRTQAEAVRGRALYAHADELGPSEDDAMWVHDLIGRTVVDQYGVDRGDCVAVVDNPADHLLELASGALVPVSFVVGLPDGRIDVDVPDGLFDL